MPPKVQPPSDLQRVLEEIRRNRSEDQKLADERHEELRKGQKEICDRISMLESDVRNLEEKTSGNSEEISKLKGNLNNVKPQQLSANVIVRGIPEVESATVSLLNIVYDVLALLGYDGQHVVKSVRRIGKHNNNQPKPIQVSVIDSDTREEIIKRKRKREIKLSEILLTDNANANNLVYIDEQLTPYTAELLRKAKAVKKELELKYVWTKNGVVHLKKNDESEVAVVRNEIELEDYRKKLKKRKRGDGSANNSLNDPKRGRGGNDNNEESMSCDDADAK